MTGLRLASAEDAEALSAIYAPVVDDTAISFEEEAPEPEEMRRRVEGTLDRLPWLVCERDGAVVGYAAAHPHRQRAAYRWAVDTSIYVAEPARGDGVGRALYEALLEVLRCQGYVHAYAGTTLPNPASEALHEAAGFEPIGTYEQVGFKHGRWHDVRWWHRPLRPLPEEPAEPVALEAVVGTEAFEAALDRGESFLDE